MRQPNRWHQILLIISLLAGSWQGMQVVHEAGHILGAWLTGGQVVHVELSPLSFSRTDLDANPRPLFVVWMGPLMGLILPLFIWDVARRIHFPEAFLLRFFAGFCLIANGGYIGVGSLTQSGDGEVMLRLGTPFWLLWLFGLVTVPVGLWLWHGEGRYFGLGRQALPVPFRATIVSLFTTGVLLIACSIFG